MYHPASTAAAALLLAALPTIGGKGVIGGLVGAIKLPTVLLPAVLRGRSPPPYTPGAPLGAKLLDMLTGSSEQPPGCFKDVFFVSADGCKLHAVEDVRRANFCPLPTHE